MLEEFYSFILSQFKGVDLSLNIVSILEILVLSGILLFLYKKFIKGTQSEKLVRGIFILVLMWIFGEILIKLNLQIFGVFLKSLVTIVSFSLIVIFQPELRRFLGYLGQQNIIKKIFIDTKPVHINKKVDVVKELVETIKYMSKSKTGGLFVIRKDNALSRYSEVGTKIDALLSQELLLTIFHPNTPLHDGAVEVFEDKILAAGVLLPLTEDPKLSWRYGTRHRAAIGMSEVSDCACIVVSEETGDVSMAIDGILKKYDDLAQLRIDLERILDYIKEDKDSNGMLFKLSSFKKTKEEKTKKQTK